MVIKLSLSKKVIETHPYPMFLPEGVKHLIVGTFPAWEFSCGDPSHFDPEVMINFNYGRIKGKNANLLWKLLSDVYEVELTTTESIKKFLTLKKIGMAEVLHKVIRIKPRNSSDANLDVQEFNLPLAAVINERKTIERIFFTGEKALSWYRSRISPLVVREIELVVLPSPSGSANRWIGGLEDYRSGKYQNTYEYRLAYYRKNFKKI